MTEASGEEANQEALFKMIAHYQEHMHSYPLTGFWIVHITKMLACTTDIDEVFKSLMSMYKVHIVGFWKCLYALYANKSLSWIQMN